MRHAPEPWGTELEATIITGIAPGTACQIWTVTGGDLHAWHPASVPVPAATLAGFDITADGQDPGDHPAAPMTSAELARRR